MTNRSRLLLMAAASGLALCGVSTAHAADADVDEVVVTGSRLVTGATSPQPLAVVGEELIQQKAPSTILEAVYEIPAFRQDSGVTNSLRGTAFGQLATTNLRGLGAGRTLTLINGLRQVTGDVNRIPSQFVKRVEVVTGGASAAYGSDAVAGVVNFIVDDEIEGIKGQVMAGSSQHSDDDRFSVDIAGGMRFAGDRGRIMGGFNYTYGGGVGTMYSRDWGRREPGQLAMPANRPAGTPATVYAYGVEFGDRTAGGLVTTAGPLRNYTFGPGGALLLFNPRTNYTNHMTGSIDNYGLGNAMGLYPLVGSLDRRTVMARVTFDITPDTQVFLDGNYMWNYSDGTFGALQQNFVVSRDNPFMPAAFRALMVANNLQTVTISKALTNFNPKGNHAGSAIQTDVDTTVWQVNGGIKGRLFEKFSWDVSGSYGEYMYDPGIANTVAIANLAAASWAVTDASGAIVCGPTASNPNVTATLRPYVEAGCVPFNVFGTDPNGAAAMAYVRKQSHSPATSYLTAFQANVRGDVWDLWAGPLSMAAGLEYRKERFVQEGNGLTDVAHSYPFAIPAWSGEESVTEGYVEANLPLLRDTGLKSLDLNLAARRTSYSNSGGVTTWKVGLSSEVNDWLRLRATRSRDIRAPGIGELFAPGALAQVQNASNPFKNAIGPLRSLGGGNPNLKPEIADTLTAGVVFQPHWGWTDGFTLSVDYYDFEINGVIAATFTAQDIVNRCYQGQTALCGNIVFDNSAFGIDYVRTGSANQNVLNYNGVDIEVNYVAPEGFLNLPGKLSARYMATWVDDQEVVNVSGVSTDRAGNAFGGMPDWTMTGSLTYDQAPFSVTLSGRYFTDVKENSNAFALGPNDPNFNSTASTSVSQNLWEGKAYFTLSGSFDVVEPEPGRRIQLFGVVENLLNTDPPDFFIVQSSGIGQTNLFDLIGRRFRIGARFAF